MVSIVSLQGVVALLGRFPALAGADLEVGESEIVLVQGPNGAGKSTLLRVCAGLLRIESGRAEVLGHDLVADRAAVRRSVGLLGHDTALYDDLTVEENLRFWARASRIDDEAVPAALDRLGVAERLRDVAVRNLSAGQRRRTALAAVVVRRPRLWLLDEPHSGLDQGGRDLIDQVILDAASAGATVMLASHELDRTLDLATRHLTVAGGTITSDERGSREPGATMLRDAWLVAAKDLQIEWRSRVTFSQVVPFAGLVLVLFGFALDANRPVLLQATSGLFWVTIMFVSTLAVQRSTSIETTDGARRALLLAGIEPPAVFVGKSIAVAVQLLVVEIVLLIGVVVLYSADIEAWGLVFATCLIATVGIAAAGTLLGALVAGVRARETVLPILLLPVLAPVLIGATRAFDDALGSVAVDGWSWLGLLAGFGVINVVLGALAYGVLLEET